MWSAVVKGNFFSNKWQSMQVIVLTISQISYLVCIFVISELADDQQIAKRLSKQIGCETSIIKVSTWQQLMTCRYWVCTMCSLPMPDLGQTSLLMLRMTWLYQIDMNFRAGVSLFSLSPMCIDRVHTALCRTKFTHAHWLQVATPPHSYHGAIVRSVLQPESCKFAVLQGLFFWRPYKTANLQLSIPLYIVVKAIVHIDAVTGAADVAHCHPLVAMNM